MNNTLINSKSQKFKTNSRHAVQLIKIMVLSIGDVNLGLNIENVYKILNFTQVYGSGLNGVGIAHVGDREVTVVDLLRHIYPLSSTGEDSPKYLVIAQNQQGELYGIPVAVIPVLKQIPASSIHDLPESYSQRDLLGFANRICNIPEEPPLTVFLLDVDRLLPVP